LIVEDEKSLLTLLKYNFEKEGYQVSEAENGEVAMSLLQSNQPDLVILDWMLPVMSGIELCRYIRRKPNLHDIPILMLTAKGEDDNKVKALNLGADDYLTKPFSIVELKARVMALLRRTNRKEEKKLLEYQTIKLDVTSRTVSRTGRPIHLGPTEFRLLHLMMLHPDKIFSREELLKVVWGPDIFVEIRTVDVHIRRLRQALNLEGEINLIRTVRSGGYGLGISIKSHTEQER
jgi:two-component system phosphate regulon response regulator PhoB